MATERFGPQLLRFALGGGVGTALHYATLILLVEVVGTDALLATTAGFAAGAIINYLWARIYVFDSTRSHASALPRFLLIATIGGALNSALMGLLLEYGTFYLWAQILATGVIFIANFLANRYWTFGH